MASRAIRPAGRSSSSPASASSPRSAPARTDNWAKLTAGQSGIRASRAFPTDGLRTTHRRHRRFRADRAVDRAPELSERLAEMAAEEAIAQSGIGTQGRFSRPAVPRRRAGRDRMAAARRALRGASGANDALELRRSLARRRDRPLSRASTSASCSARSPITSPSGSAPRARRSRSRPPARPARPRSSSASRRSGAARPRRRCASAPTARSMPRALIRFSLLSALSTSNDPPTGASKPFSKNRDGFVMAEGAGALVLESLEHAQARGAKILGVIEGCGEMADSFHRTRSSPDGKPIIGCIRNAISGCRPGAGRHRLHQRARHRHAGERQDGIHLASRRCSASAPRASRSRPTSR